MHPRQSIPRRWLMTDERFGDALFDSLRRLPPGSGVIFRHYRTHNAARRILYRRVARLAAARRLILVVSDAAGVGAHGRTHGTNPKRPPFSAPVHDRRQALLAKRSGAAALFVSPVFATRSHPGAVALGVNRAVMMAGNLGLPLIALGGMNERRFRRSTGFYGWAAIDAWRQKRKAVPT